MTESVAHQIDDIQQDNNENAQSSGRPRSKKSEEAVLEATRKLLFQQSVQKISIEAIARKAGVGKTTIYRWWPNKLAVIIDAVLSQSIYNNTLTTPRNAVEAVNAQLDKLARQLKGKNGRLVVEILGEAQSDPETIQYFTKAFLQARYDTLYSYIEGGKKTGEFSKSIHTDSAIDIVMGPIFFRLLTGQEMDDSFIDEMKTLLIKALQA
ncbi:MAG: TetR/AcrR family transcriptional regulator [Pseudomonadota bacterium]